MAYLKPKTFLTQTAKSNNANGGKKKVPLFQTEMQLPGNPTADSFYGYVHFYLAPELKQDCNYTKFIELSSPVDIGIKVQWNSHNGAMGKVEKLEEYGGFRPLYNEVTHGDIRELAIMCAGAYNALYRNARMKGGYDSVDGWLSVVHMPGLFTNNLQFKITYNLPTALDPACEETGYISFRFKFCYLVMENQ